jgi:hypothetical protein
MKIKWWALALALYVSAAALSKPWDVSRCSVTKEQVENKYSGFFKHSEVRKELLSESFVAYDCFTKQIENRRYLVIIDYKPHSSKKRFFLIDVSKGAVESFLTAHGRGSDPEHSGYAQKFSDVPNSKASSLGFYTTAEIYNGGHGKTLALDGKSPTNQNARKRSVVIHGASYVDASRPKMGRSWGCPSLAPKDLDSVINRIKGGSLLGVFK